MWRVYKHTGKDKDYEVYKEALNAATNEVRKAKRNFEHKLAQNIKSDSKSFYAYVRSKQNVRDKVGPLEDNADTITEGCLMAEELWPRNYGRGINSVQCSRGKILVRYLYQKQSSMDQRRKSWGS